MNYSCNMAIQLLPLAHDKKKSPYIIIDEVIELVRLSGLKYKVCPFETVIEGSYDELTSLLKVIQHKAFEAGASETIINIKLHAASDRDVFINDKMEKYEK